MFLFVLLLLPESQNKNDKPWVHVDDKTDIWVNLENSGQCHKVIGMWLARETG